MIEQLHPPLQPTPEDILRARFLLHTVRNSELGTVHADGTGTEVSLSPRETIVAAIYVSSPDPEKHPLTAYIQSFPDTQHVFDYATTEERVALAVAHSFSPNNALNLAADIRELSDDERRLYLPGFEALRRVRFAIANRPADMYDPTKQAVPLRLYRARITGATMPASPVVPNPATGQDGRAVVPLDALRGFENDPWRWRLTKDVAAFAWRMSVRGLRRPLPANLPT